MPVILQVSSVGLEMLTGTDSREPIQRKISSTLHQTSLNREKTGNTRERRIKIPSKEQSWGILEL